jgi:AP endonuclease-2
VLASKGLEPWFKYSDIQPDIMGSDHCPVYADFLPFDQQYDEGEDASSSPLLTSNFPEFKQKNNLRNYFTQPSSSPSIFKSSPSSSPSSTQHTLSPTNTSSSSVKRSLPSTSHLSPSPTKKSKSGIIESFFVKKPKDTTKEQVITEEEVDIDVLISKAEAKQVTAKSWTSLFQAPQIPRCKEHNEPCVERTVTKKGPNFGRVFYLCAKPVGPKDGPKSQYSCNYFQWKQQQQKKK